MSKGLPLGHILKYFLHTAICGVEVTMIDEGSKAPDFSLKDENGKTWTLADFAGKKFILYFYPRDNTHGCTTEACSFRDNYQMLKERGLAVVGVSPDTEASHRKFKEKFNLPFILLADPDRQVLQAYGAYGEKIMYGKKVMGVIRSTVVIDESGTIIKVFPKVSPDHHVQELLEIL